MFKFLNFYIIFNNKLSSMEKKKMKLKTTVQVILGIILAIFVLGIISLFTYAIRKMFKILKRDRVVMIGDHLEGV